jgi:four helix bundle protein
MVMVTKVYESTQKFHKEEIYSLTSQIRRAAVSVPSNISEGFGRRTTADFTYFLHISKHKMNEFFNLPLATCHLLKK